MLNEEVQAWMDMGFSEEEATTMAHTVRSRYNDVKIMDDDSEASPGESFGENTTT